MKWLLAISLIVLACGPLRPWIGRHWALLLSIIAGAMGGFLATGWVMATMRQSFPGLGLLSAVIGAIAFGRAGPALLRHLEKDGRDHEPGRH